MVNLSPPLGGPRFSIIDETIRKGSAGNLALIVSTRPQSDLSVACVPEGRIGSREQRCARDQMSIVRSRMPVEPPSQPLFALVTQWEERENVA